MNRTTISRPLYMCTARSLDDANKCVIRFSRYPHIAFATVCHSVLKDTAQCASFKPTIETTILSLRYLLLSFRPGGRFR